MTWKSRLKAIDRLIDRELRTKYPSCEVLHGYLAVRRDLVETKDHEIHHTERRKRWEDTTEQELSLLIQIRDALVILAEAQKRKDSQS